MHVEPAAPAATCTMARTSSPSLPTRPRPRCQLAIVLLVSREPAAEPAISVVKPIGSRSKLVPSSRTARREGHRGQEHGQILRRSPPRSTPPSTRPSGCPSRLVDADASAAQPSCLGVIMTAVRGRGWVRNKSTATVSPTATGKFSSATQCCSRSPLGPRPPLDRRIGVEPVTATHPGGPRCCPSCRPRPRSPRRCQPRDWMPERWPGWSTGQRRCWARLKTCHGRVPRARPGGRPPRQYKAPHPSRPRGCPGCRRSGSRRPQHGVGVAARRAGNPQATLHVT